MRITTFRSCQALHWQIYFQDWIPFNYRPSLQSG